MTKHELFGGKVHLYKRSHEGPWQCSTYLAGRNWRVSTRRENLIEAEAFAEDWYLTLRGKQKAGELRSGKTFEQWAAIFENEFEVLTGGERSPEYVKTLKLVIRVHLIPFFRGMTAPEITEAAALKYRMHRVQTSAPGKPPARGTIHHEIIALRHVLKTAKRHGGLETLPDLSPPYKASGKVGHRAWFTAQEYRQLYMATRERAKFPLKERWRWECEQLHDFVLFMGNTGLRPDEAWQLQYRDVKIVKDFATAQTILEIEVRGKRGVGHCKSMPGAVRPFTRLRNRNSPQPSDLLFPGDQRELLNTILAEQELKFDRDGNRRTAYSLRHTYICLRLMEGADIYQVAKNCRTSVEMIEKHYAVHLKNTLDASAINVKRQRPARKSKRGRQRPKDSAWRAGQEAL